ncbi:hypothetical protein, partial [Brevundimonas sp. TWP2-3-2]|uniref:hypothetical protein n=1 Tax=Brevundimonas sp. TWP2-3-2 TaxID=2804648 RepID=UPI003CF756FF
MGLQDIDGFTAAATAEELLIDVAGRIQLSRTKHDQAVTHYEALCAHVDRQGSLLEPERKRSWVISVRCDSVGVAKLRW